MNENGIFHKIKGDGIIWMVFFFLCAISIIEVFSSSSVITYKASYYWMPALKHAAFLALGCILMVCTMNIKCKYFKIVTPFALLISFVLLVVVLVIGESTNGAQRWISVFGLQFQPSELAKGAVVLAVAQVLSAMQTENGADRHAFKYIMWITLPAMLLIGKENLSTAALLFVTVLLMMFIGRVPKGQLGRLLGLLAIIAVVGIAAIMYVGKGEEAAAPPLAEQTVVKEDAGGDAGKRETSPLSWFTHRMQTWKSRMNSFLNNEKVPPEKFDLNENAQYGHSNIAIVSSNIIGKGPGNSTERDFLPQAFSDFIYAIIIEEMGIVGAAFVCLLYIILLFRTATIANRCVNTFPALLVMGIALLLVTQAMFNMMVAVGLAPITGQPLPLISKGGTSTIVNCIYIGVILSVSCSAKKRDEEPAPAVNKATRDEE